MVAEVARRCRADDRIAAALTYGSVVQGLDDEFSDAEFWIFTTAENADWVGWIRELGPVLHVIENEFGALVAFLTGGFRCEFHICPTTAIPEVMLWPGRSAAVEDMVLVDTGGELAAALGTIPHHPAIEPPSAVCGRFFNWWLLGWNVLQRGEYERAVDALSHVRRHLLWMARLRQEATLRWLTPSRLAERDLPAADLGALARLTAPPAEALAAAWALGLEWSVALGSAPPDALRRDIEALIAERG
jgi:lincosamide nucleotidyltransferase